MALIESLIGPIASIIDKVIPDRAARDRAKLELLSLEGTQELQQIQAQMSAIIAEAQSPDPWTSRARPSFLYVMYTMLLFAIPMGVIAAFRPQAAQDIAAGMRSQEHPRRGNANLCSSRFTSPRPLDCRACASGSRSG